jgi:hypothetical protein
MDNGYCSLPDVAMVMVMAEFICASLDTAVYVVALYCLLSVSYYGSRLF